MNQMNIAYVCDERYIPFLIKSIETVKRYNPSAQFSVITRDIKQIPEIPGLPDIYIHNISPDSSQFKYRQNDRMQEGVYYKFWLPELPYDKVLYLDTDIICQRPLTDLWKEKCQYICATESHDYGKKQAIQLGLPKYANTGVMLMNIKALREINFTQRCLNRLSIESPDQHDETIINLEFQDKIRYLDHKYNYCRERKYEHPIPESDAYNLHYIGGKQKAEMIKLNNFHTLDPLREKLKGKRVAIVGNSSALLTKGQGKEIDGHDIVIRFNKGFPSEKVGQKTDIVFLACTLTLGERLKYVNALSVKRSKLCRNLCDFKVATPDRIALRQGNEQASTGFIAINFALSSECKSIDLYGFDFFENTTYYNPEGYQTMHNGQKEAEKVLEYEKNGLLTIN